MPSFASRLVAALLVSLLGICAGGATNAGAAAEPYVIGAVLSESGPGATLGRPEADSMEMGVDEITRPAASAGIRSS